MTPSTRAHDEYLAFNLMLVRTGRKARASGIRCCPDCTEPFIDDRVGLAQCPDCRVNHRRYCPDCRALIPNTSRGDRLCESCQDQIPLFSGTELTS